VTSLPVNVEKAVQSTSVLTIWDWIVSTLGSSSNPIAQWLLSGLEALLAQLAPNALADAKLAAPSGLLAWIQTLIAEAPQIAAIVQTVIAEIEKFLPKS
jgi:hypothetical protein